MIGKRASTSRVTHAWVEWETAKGTLVLDPTLNWRAYQGNTLAGVVTSLIMPTRVLRSFAPRRPPSWPRIDFPRQTCPRCIRDEPLESADGPSLCRPERLCLRRVFRIAVFFFRLRFGSSYPVDYLQRNRPVADGGSFILNDKIFIAKPEGDLYHPFFVSMEII